MIETDVFRNSKGLLH